MQNQKLEHRYTTVVVIGDRYYYYTLWDNYIHNVIINYNEENKN